MKDLVAQIIKIDKKCLSNLKHAFHYHEIVEALIEEKLKSEPENIELWLRLAVLEIEPPIVDDPKSIACVEKVLALDQDNALAWLLLAFLRDFSYGNIDEPLVNKLMSIHTADPELNSMLKYAASWFFWRKKNQQKEVELLKESIAIYDGHVFNYKHLARIYLSQGKKSEAKELAKKAPKNITKVYPSVEPFEPCDFTDVDRFVNEHIKGIYLTVVNFDGIKEDFDLN